MAGVLHGPLHAQGPPLPGPLPSRVLHPDEQLQRNQPFYVPTVQPLFPYQWPMSTPYVPYSGFHGLGYGMMPLLLPQCLEVPGYVIPHAQLPILDHRRMTPRVAPTIAHQTHRFNFQNNVPVGRVMVSSEVQTEPLRHSVDSHGQAARSQNCSESGRGTVCGSPVSISPCSLDNKSVDCPEGTAVLTQTCNVTNANDTNDLSAVPKREILQAERVQITCSEMPSGLKIFQNMELAGHNETDLLQCSLTSVQSSEDVVLCSYQSLALRKDKQRVEAGMLRYSSKHCLPACTETNVARTPPSSRTFKTYPKPSRSVITQSIKAKKTSEMPFQAKVKENGNSSNVHFKILRLPFDKQNHNQPCQIEASIWSVESLIPYVPSSEWMMENGLLTPPKPLSPLIEPSDSISKPNCSPLEKNLQTGTSTKYRVSHQLEASLWSVESLMPYVPSNEWMVENEFLTPPQKPLRSQIKPSNILSELNRSSTSGVPKGENLQAGASTKRGDSLKARSPYRPSTSWLADFGNVYYYSKLPVVGQQPNVPERRPPNMSFAISLESSPHRNGRETRNQRPAIGVSDQKHTFHTCKCKAKSSQRVAGSAVTCGWVSHSTLEKKLPFCPSCRYDMKGKDHGRPFSYGLGCKREEIAEVKNSDEKRATGGVHNDQKMTLGSHFAKCYAAYQPRIRDQTGPCENCQCLNASPAQDECVDLEWRIWETSGEDWIMNPNDRLLQKLQKEDAWKGHLQASNTERRIQKKQSVLSRTHTRGRHNAHHMERMNTP